jgi:predicted RNase H-like HicB family nuclease
MLIEWSDRDQAYIVSLPEWGSGAKTHGTTYAEAVANGQEVLELLIETQRAHGWPLPPARMYAAAS